MGERGRASSPLSGFYATRARATTLPSVTEIAAELWACDHDDGKARHGITLVTHSANPFDPDNYEAWKGYQDAAQRVLRLVAGYRRTTRSTPGGAS